MALSNSSFVVDVPPHGVPVQTIRDDLATAESHIQSGDLPRAERAYADILQVAPYSAEAWFFLGLIKQQKEAFAEAAQHYQQALYFTPRFPEARNNLGVALQSLGEIDEAEACFREALQLDPDYAEA